MFVDLLARPSGLLKRMYRVFWYSFDTTHEIIISTVINLSCSGILTLVNHWLVRFLCRIAWSIFIVNYIFTEWIVWKFNMKMSFYCLQVNNIHIHRLTLQISLLLPSFSETLRSLLRLSVIRLLTCSWTVEDICHFINNSTKILSRLKQYFCKCHAFILNDYYLL